MSATDHNDPRPYFWPDEITYRGSDGQRHYGRIVARHSDGTVTLSRGYYGTARLQLTPVDDARNYHTGEPVR